MWAELVEWAKKHMLAHDPQLASPEDMNIPVCVPTLEAALDHLEPHIAAFQATRAKARS
jgi:hypothetical protein